jgi:hypothetical protein
MEEGFVSYESLPLDYTVVGIQACFQGPYFFENMILKIE